MNHNFFTMSVNNDFLYNLKQDRLYSAFLTDSFNLENTITLINNLQFNDQLMRISSGIELVKQYINSLSSQNSEEFFQRTSKLGDLYEELQFVSIKSQNLSKTLDLIKSKLETPYHQLLRQITLISRLQKTCDLLRKMLRIIYLTKRIYECNLDTVKNEHTIFLKEILKVSQYINEVDIILSDQDQQLSKIKLIKNDLEQICLIKTKIEENTDELIKSGLISLDSNLIGTALQVYHNLGLLDSKLQLLITDKCNFISQSVSKTFASISSTDQQNKHNATSKSYRANLRNDIKMLLETIYTNFNQISTVVKILRKRRDNLTQNLLIDSLCNKDTIMPQFWSQIIKIMIDSFSKFSCESTLFKQTIESDYPKILAIFLDFCKLASHDELEFINEKSLRYVLQHFESAYLSNSLSLLIDSVNRVFSDAKGPSNVSNNSNLISIPCEKNIGTIIKNITNELTVASFDLNLVNSVCKNIQKTINVFMEKCEYLVCVDGDATQVIGSFTTSQRHNALIVHILNYFVDQMRSLTANDSYLNDICQKINDSLSSIDTLILNIIEPLINSIQDAIEAIILTLHNEDFNTSVAKSGDVQCSLYMKELQRFIYRVSQDYLKQFTECDAIKQRIFKMTARTIDLFLLHNCIVNPVSNGGRMQISKDFTQFELAIVPICERMGDIGRSFQIFRAFKTLLFLSPEEISKSPVLGNPVPFHLVLHFLISNYRTDELKLPQKFKGLSVTLYSKWIEKATVEQRLSLINDTLDSYVQQVRKSQKTTFAPVYPFLVEIMRKALNEQSH